jgi:hypothetical protein
MHLKLLLERHFLLNIQLGQPAQADKKANLVLLTIQVIIKTAIMGVLYNSRIQVFMELQLKCSHPSLMETHRTEQVEDLNVVSNPQITLVVGTKKLWNNLAPN